MPPEYIKPADALSMRLLLERLVRRVVSTFGTQWGHARNAQLHGRSHLPIEHRTLLRRSPLGDIEELFSICGIRNEVFRG